jgi:hypothetical protein
MGITRRHMMNLGCTFVGIPAAAAASRRASAAERQGDDDPGPGKPAPQPGREAMDALWVDLEKEEPDASRALLKLAARPDDAVAFLKGKMKRLTLEVDRLNDLLFKLGEPDENDWKPAFEELEYFDPRLAVDLETLMHDVTDPTTRGRMVEVLSGRRAGSLEGKEVALRRVGNAGEAGFNFFSKPGGSWWAEGNITRINSTPWGNRKVKWTRAVRAIALLEHLGTPDAVAVLKDMASGHPSAQPTVAAAEALGRLGGRGR